MALTMAEKSVTSFLFKRLTINLLQTFKLSTTQNPNSSPPSTTPTTSESSTKSKQMKKKKKKKKNKEEKTLFQIARDLPRYGKGCHLARLHCPNVTYQITRINVTKDSKHGKVWALAFKDGIPARFPSRLGGTLEPCWKHIKDPLILEAPKPDGSIPHPLELEAPKPDESISDSLKSEAPKPDAALEA